MYVCMYVRLSLSLSLSLSPQVWMDRLNLTVQFCFRKRAFKRLSVVYHVPVMDGHDPDGELWQKTTNILRTMRYDNDDRYCERCGRHHWTIIGITRVITNYDDARLIFMVDMCVCVERLSLW